MQEEFQQEKWRARARNALAAYFRRRSLTAFMVGFLMALTGLCGFLISYGLLHLGVERMAIRYPVAVVGAYAVFLVLIRAWVEWERSRFDPASEEFQTAFRQAVSAAPAPEKTHGDWNPDRRSSWLDWLDLPEIPSDLMQEPGDGCLLLVALVVFFGLIALVAMSLMNASALMAEGFLDTFLIVGLYRRLRHAAREHSLGTTIRKTWSTALVVAALLAILGYFLQWNAPEARSIGPAVRHLFHPES